MNTQGGSSASPGNAPLAPSRPLVSVVVPTFDGKAFIAETLASVFAQTHRALEVIVVDDGSSDGTPEYIASLGYPTQMLRHMRGGVSSARNAGAAQARGDFVCFLDQDDVWYPDHLERQLAVFEELPETGAVVSPYFHWYPGAAGYPAATAVLPPKPAADVDADFTGWVHHQFMFDCWALTSATTIRRAAWERHGGFDPTRAYGEDWDLWLRLAQHVRFAKLNWPPVLYRQHPEQGSRRVRSIDYRTRLLDDAARRWGLQSRDGRQLDRLAFRRQMSIYETCFGYDHLRDGERWIGVRALFSAWLRNPLAVRSLALCLAGSAGYRPARTPLAVGTARRKVDYQQES